MSASRISAKETIRNRAGTRAGHFLERANATILCRRCTSSLIASSGSAEPSLREQQVYSNAVWFLARARARNQTHANAPNGDAIEAPICSINRS